jgi:hypothetical protein
MRIVNDGAYRCAWCGEVLDIPAEPPAEVVIRVAREHPIVRTLQLHGRDIHQCDIGNAAPYDWATDPAQ